MGDENKGRYYAIPIDHVQFTKDEIVKMGIYFLKGLSDLPLALSEFGVYNVDVDRDLIDYGYTLSQVGPLRDGINWVVYSKDLSPEFVSDVWNKKGFYSIIRETHDETVQVFDKVHLRKDHLNEDFEYYIKLDTKHQEEQYPVLPGIH